MFSLPKGLKLSSPPLRVESQYEGVASILPAVVTGEHKDGGMSVVGAVVLETVHAEAVLVAGVEGCPRPSNGAVNLKQDREMR